MGEQLLGILFSYNISVFSDHKNLVYAARTVSELQRVMILRLILKEFGQNIQCIAGIDNVVADMLSLLPSASNHGQVKLEASNVQSHAYENLHLKGA